MKRYFGFALIMCALSIPAFAAKNSKDVTFARPVAVGSTQVPAGDYKVSWTGADANLQVTITRDGKNIATTPAKLVPANNGSFSLQTETVKGSEVLETIQFNKFSIVIAKPTASGE